MLIIQYAHTRRVAWQTGKYGSVFLFVLSRCFPQPFRLVLLQVFPAAGYLLIFSARMVWF